MNNTAITKQYYIVSTLCFWQNEKFKIEEKNLIVEIVNDNKNLIGYLPVFDDYDAALIASQNRPELIRSCIQEIQEKQGCGCGDKNCGN